MKNVFTYVFCVLFSCLAFGENKSYNGYTLDETRNVVTSDVLEWMCWDQTIGLSIEDALQKFGGDGWRIATDSEMADLFNAFSFGDEKFSADENVVAFHHLAPGLPRERAVLFTQLFGNVTVGRYPTRPDLVEANPTARALFGSDADADGLYRVATVSARIHKNGKLFKAQAQLSADNPRFGKTSRNVRNWGVALVRDRKK
jgi:hypothetical protein